MNTKRPINMNISLVHGICNMNCKTCGVNKPSFKGPKAYQHAEVTRKITERIREAAGDGIYIRYIAISGDGEPTLHPEFEKRMNTFGNLLKNWNSKKILPPEIAVVSNGLNLTQKNILANIANNDISLKISFPTANPSHYGEVMTGSALNGQSLINQTVTSVHMAMEMAREGKLKSLSFHISPPDKYTYLDFPETIEFLAGLASQHRLSKLKLVIFPVIANRTGLVKGLPNRLNDFKNYFKMFNKKRVKGVLIEMVSVLKIFYWNIKEIGDVLKSFYYPCIWNGNIFLSPFGDSCCVNDQNISEPLGNVCDNSILEIMEMKEQLYKYKMCDGCNQKPENLNLNAFFRLYGIVVKIKRRFVKKRSERSLTGK